MANEPDRIKLTTFLLMLVITLPGLTTAQTRAPVDVQSLGPQVGERVPDFRLPDQHGQIQTLEAIIGPNGPIVLFHRSANW